MNTENLVYLIVDGMIIGGASSLLISMVLSGLAALIATWLLFVGVSIVTEMYDIEMARPAYEAAKSLFNRVFA